MKRTLLTLLCVVLISSIVVGQSKAPTRKQNIHRNGGIACGNDPILPTDGSPTDDYVPSGSSSWYYVHLKAGHSYSVDVWDSTDTVIGGSATLALIALDCSTTVSTTDQTSVDPDLSNNFGARISWIQVSDASAYLQVGTTDPSGDAYTVRITDTTLHNPRWTTWSKFTTSYGFLNTTSSDISGTLTVTDGTSGTKYAVNVTVPHNGQVFEIVSGTGSGSPGLNLPPDRAGFAAFTFVGPPGAILADAYYLNGNASVVVPSIFDARNDQH